MKHIILCFLKFIFTLYVNLIFLCSLTKPFRGDAESVLAEREFYDGGSRTTDLVAMQLPFIIGAMFSISGSRLKRCLKRSLGERITKIIYDDTKTSLQRRDLCLLHSSMESRKALVRLLCEEIRTPNQKPIYKDVHIFHLDENHMPNKCSEPSTSTVNEMVAKFVDFCVQESGARSIVKEIIVAEIFDLLSNISNKISLINKGVVKYDIFGKALDCLKNLIRETVVLSFNGGE